MVGDAVQFAFAVPVQVHHGLVAGVRQTQQRAGDDLFVDLGQVLAASGIFEHHLAVELDARCAGLFGFLARIDEYQIDVGLVALVE